jgi:prophage antirepressor-like protein
MSMVAPSASQRGQGPHRFDFQGAEIRTVLVDGEPWWVAADICSVLELAQAASSLRLLDPDEKGMHSMHTPGGEQLVTTINEPGLYSLILRSRKPQAKAFKRWITHEVIPAIRQTGSYTAKPMDELELAERQVVLIREKRAALARRTVRPRRSSRRSRPATG